MRTTIAECRTGLLELSLEDTSMIARAYATPSDVTLMTSANGEEKRQRHSIECSAEDCRRNVREGKPYCATHRAKNPYAGAIVQLLEERTKELEKILNRNYDAKPWKGVDVGGVIVKAILTALRSAGGELTEKEIAVECSISRKAVRRCIIALMRKGMVERSKKSLVALPRTDD